MNTGTAVAVGVAIAAAVGAGVWYMQAKPAPHASSQDDTAIRAMVAEFGTKLQMVSLLAPTAARKVAMDEYYGPYVAPELLAAWYPEGAEGALGRRTSSPWPERIEVVAVEQIGEGLLYHVDANIIEVAPSTSSGQATQVFAVQPVTFTIEQLDGRWIIVGVEKGAYSELPQRRVVVGYWECLPKKGPGPHTMECAFGIAVDQSDGHMAVNTSLMSTYPVDFPTGTKVRIEGVVTPAMALSSDHWQSYDIDGIISATRIEKVE